MSHALAADGKPIVEEIRTITLLNIDIRGFSQTAMQIGSQKTVTLLNSFFSAMGGIVFKHHGIVDKYLGDGFLALFGAPVASTRDADNAVAAAFEMKHSLPTVNKHIERQLGASVTMGISIHTGEVVVGNIGFEKKMDYTVPTTDHPVKKRVNRLLQRVRAACLSASTSQRPSIEW